MDKAGWIKYKIMPFITIHVFNQSSEFMVESEMTLTSWVYEVKSLLKTQKVRSKCLNTLVFYSTWSWLIPITIQVFFNNPKQWILRAGGMLQRAHFQMIPFSSGISNTVRTYIFHFDVTDSNTKRLETLWPCRNVLYFSSLCLFLSNFNRLQKYWVFFYEVH